MMKMVFYILLILSMFGFVASFIDFVYYDNEDAIYFVILCFAGSIVGIFNIKNCK